MWWSKLFTYDAKSESNGIKSSVSISIFLRKILFDTDEEQSSAILDPSFQTWSSLRLIDEVLVFSNLILFKFL